MEIIGLIPAGGTGSRLGKHPGSKEMFPVLDQSGKISAISENLLRCFKIAGITEIYFILRKGKWDIPEYFGDGEEFGMNIGYLLMNLPHGTPFTLNQAFPFIQNKMVALGFPDILFEPEDALIPIKDKLLSGNADIMLGLVPSTDYLKSDMIEMDEKGIIKRFVIKQNRPDLKYSWFVALWRPSFSIFLHETLKELMQNEVTNPGPLIHPEIFMGDVFQIAIERGLKLEYVLFEKGKYLDIGTPDALRNWIKSR